MACCNDSSCHDQAPVRNGPYRRILILALALNFLMFLVEILAALHSGSLALLAESIDFLGDAANYAVSLFVLNRSALARSRTAFAKGFVMTSWGILILLRTVPSLSSQAPPEAFTMTWVGILALGVNVGVALSLWKFREGDANRRSVWLCSRNDAIGNLAILIAAGLVAWTGRPWPDVLVAFLMSVLALSAGTAIMRQSSRETRN
ncbi:MAG: putative zinc transport protein [Fibrobacterota bacterium]|jgi:cation diffusion facilitator family transporter